MEASSTSTSGDDDEDSDLQSMTARGIKHLCSELIELKVASSEDFHSHIYANYSSFVRVFEKVGRLESELMQLKNHVSNQKRILSQLVDGVSSRFLSENRSPLNKVNSPILCVVITSFLLYLFHVTSDFD